MSPPRLDLPDVLGYLNAVELADVLNEGLTRWELAHRLAGQPGDLDAEAVRLLSSTPRILGQQGRIVDRHHQPGKRAPLFTVAFTVRQATAMGELLADALPELAARAHEAEKAAGPR